MNEIGIRSVIIMMYYNVIFIIMKKHGSERAFWFLILFFKEAVASRSIIWGSHTQNKIISDQDLYFFPTISCMALHHQRDRQGWFG
jgi:hypothetical protein